MGFLLFILLLLSGTAIQAQENNYEGLWKGLMSQNDRAVLYDVVLKLFYESDSTLFGTCKIVARDGKYVEFYVEGQYQGSNLLLKDVMLLKESGSNEKFHWCIKDYLMTLSGTEDKWSLEGDWKNDGKTFSKGKYFQDTYDCKPGKFSLSKVKGATIFKPGIDEKVRYFQGRFVEVQQTLDVNADQLELNFIDNNQIDNDTITVFYNKDMMVKQHRLSHDTLKLVIDILPNTDNLLIIYANNVGLMPPNTAELIYYEEGVKKQLNIYADHSKNAGVIIRRKEE